MQNQEYRPNKIFEELKNTADHQIWLTSDEHYGHTNIIKYCKRPFNNAQEMDRTIIETHNKYVGESDIVIHLGDFTFQNKRKALAILRQLNGKHVLIRGNHDSWLEGDAINHHDMINSLNYTEQYPKLLLIQDYLEINKSIFCHYPMFTWHHSYKGSFHFHGHCHGNINEENKHVRRMDVGIDSIAKYTGEYAPINFAFAKKLLAKRNHNFVDVKE